MGLRTSRWLTVRSAKLVIALGTLALCSTSAVAQECVAAPQGLVSWWPGEDSADDIAGENDGAPFNGAHFVEGLVGNGFSFDGLGDVVIVPSDASLEPASFTWEFWLNTPGQICTGAGRFCRVISRGIDDGVHNESLEIALMAPGGIFEPPNGLFFTSSFAQPWTFTGIVVPTDDWTHITMTYDASSRQARFYQNGQWVNTITTSGVIEHVGEIHVGAQRAQGGWDEA